MKANKKFVEDKEAVSAVIGVILMVAITVAIAATVYVYVSGMIGGSGQTTATITMNTYESDDVADQVVWYVAGIQNGPLGKTDFQWSLLNETGANISGTTININDNNGDGDVNAGDTIVVNAGADGSYTFVMTDPSTGGNIYKSARLKY